VIIPTLNEAACLGDTLERLCRDRPAEIIVADGGSTDGTVQIAERFVRVVRCPRGRAAQQNCAAALATGELLFFLHADCWPEPGWQDAARRVACRRDFVAACFRMRIDDARPIYRLIEAGGDLRVRCFGLAYGDQGILLPRGVFFQLGGFPAVTFMEDLLLMQRVRRLGRVRLLPARIHISPRRWELTGTMRQTLINWTLTALAVGAGISPDRLARYYPVVR
jgi:rSAM/selenodomain-associated transferase 2